MCACARRPPIMKTRPRACHLAKKRISSYSHSEMKPKLFLLIFASLCNLFFVLHALIIIGQYSENYSIETVSKKLEEHGEGYLCTDEVSKQ